MLAAAERRLGPVPVGSQTKHLARLYERVFPLGANDHGNVRI